MPQKISTSGLSQELKRYIHKDFQDNEKRYWELKDTLVEKYRGKWIAFHEGKVIAVGNNIFDVTREVGSHPCHAYITKVGEEEKVVFKRRRVQFSYNITYPSFSLPQARVKFSNFSGTASRVYEDVIPDTGSDGSALPLKDCEAIELFDSPYLVSLSKGIGGPEKVCLVYQGIAEINGIVVPSLIEALSAEEERILGRDVLNQLTVTFKGKDNKVIFEE